MTEALCSIAIDFEAIRKNYHLLTAHKSTLMPVVKSDAYGHGFIEVSEVLQEEGVNYFAVGTVTEGILLRRAGISGTIVPLLGCTKAEEYELCSRHKITTVVHNKESLEASLAHNMDIAIKVDTGMGRLGFRPKDMEWVAKELQGKKTKPSIMLSHFSSSDSIEDDDYTQTQSVRMNVATNILKNTYPDMLTSLGNSATILAFPELSGDIPRPGILIYGGNPFYNTKREYLAADFEPVMSLTAPVLSVHKLSEGDSLSYGKSFTAKRDSVIAWVAMGYADGYRRNSATNDENGRGGTQIVIHNMRCPVIGRITMQMTAVDVTDLIKKHEVKAGDTACLLNGCENGIKLDELALWWGTIPYEVTTSLGKNLYHFREC